MARSHQDAQGIQSIEIGGSLLKTLAERGGPTSLTALAVAGMPASKARRYLLNFARGAGNTGAGQRALRRGGLALQLRLIAQRNLDAIREGGAPVNELAQDLNHTVALIVWSDRGRLLSALSPAGTAWRSLFGSAASGCWHPLRPASCFPPIGPRRKPPASWKLGKTLTTEQFGKVRSRTGKQQADSDDRRREGRL